jgi:hypothetical protein
MILRRMLAIAAAIPLLVAACACASTPAPHPEPDTSARGSCSAVCANELRLGCPAAKPTPDGATCVAVCTNVQASGIIRWDLACRARATSCDAADACEASK